MNSLLCSKKSRTAALALALALVCATALYLLFFNAPDPYVLAGQRVVVTITAESVSDMYGYQFKLGYNPDDFEYDGELVSAVEGIQTIFSRPFDGYELVGAVMVGDVPGFSGKNFAVCRILLTAKKDGRLSNMPFSLDGVNVVRSDLEYIKDLPGWGCQVKVEA